jgi:hypothetical protein
MNDVLLESKRMTLLDLLDRLLETGVVVDGEIDLSVADIDLIHLGLKLVLASSATLEQHSNGSGTHVVDPPDEDPPGYPLGSSSDSDVSPDRAAISAVTDTGQEGAPVEQAGTLAQPRTGPEGPRGEGLRPRIDFEPAKVEQGLAKLVLTLVELIRRLMEKQAIRKMEGGTLNRSQLEQLGETFKRLESKMVELKRVFGLEDEDLNLDLGPLGELM